MRAHCKIQFLRGFRKKKQYVWRLRKKGSLDSLEQWPSD